MAKVLLSAYACRPHTGSEPGVGWNFAQRVAAHHEVWVVTRADNCESIEAWRKQNPGASKSLHFVYHDVPRWVHLLFPGNVGNQVRYMVWQSTLLRTVRPLHDEVNFDVAQHVTYVRYWTASRLPKLPVPFIWGPVGGAESAPKSFKPGLGLKGRLVEFLRETARRIAELDPRVRSVASRAALSLATTEETAGRLRAMGATRVLTMTEAGLPREEIEALLAPEPGAGEPFAFISMARLLYWKGFHLGLAAFAQARLPNARYVVVGDGPEMARLKNDARRLGIAGQVDFVGRLPRSETLAKLAKCHVLVHPSLHDSGGWVCLEAMASGRPVICLDLGGPATQVTDETGFRIRAGTPDQAIADMAAAMRRLHDDAGLRRRMAAAGPRRVMEGFCWDEKVRRMNGIYAELMAGARPASASPTSIATPIL
jgi:glycosyltransferase involved in cell wall biosynthesis